MKTAQTLSLLAAIGQLTFREMNANDRCGFDGASDDAQICYHGTEGLIEPLGALLDEQLGTEAPLVIVSGVNVEVHAMTPDYSPVCLGLTLDCLI